MPPTADSQLHTDKCAKGPECEYGCMFVFRWGFVHAFVWLVLTVDVSAQLVPARTHACVHNTHTYMHI